MASFDLGALITGLSQGLGRHSDIQFAEKLRQAAEGRAFDEKRQLAGEGFEREKELRLFIDELQRKAQLARDEVRAGERDEDRADRQERERLDRAMGFLERERQGEIDTLNEEYKRWQMSMPPRGAGGRGGTGQDNQTSDAQWVSAYNSAYNRLQAKADAAQAVLDDRYAKPGEVESAKKVLKELTPQKIEDDARAAADRVSGALASRGATAPEAAPEPGGEVEPQGRAEALLTTVLGEGGEGAALVAPTLDSIGLGASPPPAPSPVAPVAEEGGEGNAVSLLLQLFGLLDPSKAVNAINPFN